MGTFGIDWAITHNKASIGEVFLKKNIKLCESKKKD